MHNWRLTIENAKVGEHIRPESRLSFACIKHGPKPRLVKSNAQLDKIIEYISNGNLTDVGILVYYNDQVKQIRDYFQSRGIPVQWKTKDEMEIDFKSTSPKIITWHCAKDCNSMMYSFHAAVWTNTNSMFNGLMNL